MSPIPFVVLLLVVSCAMFVNGRPTASADQVLPLILSSLHVDASDLSALSNLNSQTRLKMIVEQIIKYDVRCRA
jgi:hypothetical protein